MDWIKWPTYASHRSIRTFQDPSEFMREIDSFDHEPEAAAALAVSSEPEPDPESPAVS